MSEFEDKTLCALVEEGAIDAHENEYKKLISEPQYFCRNCERAAVNSENLCNPEDLT